MAEVKILSDDMKDQWDRFVQAHDLGTIYHTSLWQKLIAEVYGIKGFILYIDDGNGNIRSGLPISVVGNKLTGHHLSSLSCAQFCNPLIKEEKDFKQFISFILDINKKSRVGYYELRCSAKFAVQNTENWSIVTKYVTYLLDIDRPIDIIKKTFHKNCIQRPILKTAKNGLKLRVGNSESDVKTFYNLYADMRRDEGLLPQPYSFFSKLWQIMSLAGHIEILNAEYENKIISTILLLKYKDTVIYEYGASNLKMRTLNPSHFLLWTAIENSIREGYKKFDFGRTSIDDEGLNQFKQRWGTQPEALVYYYIPSMRGASLLRNSSWANIIMNRTVKILPMPLSQFAGKIIYPHIV